MKQQYQKESEKVKSINGYYYPKYSDKRIIIKEEKFFEIFENHQNKYLGLNNEHKLISQFHYFLKKIYKISSESKLSTLQSVENENLLFYHWYERRYNVKVINEEVLYSLNYNYIFDLFSKYSKKELNKEINDRLSENFKSERFPQFTIYYEFYFDFFPDIERFSFEELQQVKFLIKNISRFSKY